MPFIWRHKSAKLATQATHPEALSCLEAAYVLVDLARGDEIISHNMHSVLGVNMPLADTIGVMDALKADSRPRLMQALAALKQGQVIAPMTLVSEDGNRAFIARATICPGAEAESRYGVLWLYDIS